MPDKLPDNFDPKRYLAAYPDVALTGMDPGQHYLLFGKLMGRNPSGKSAATAEQTSPKPPKATLQKEKTPRPSNQAEVAEVAEKPAAIIDRPADFEPEGVIPAPAPSKPGADENGVFTLKSLEDGLEDAVALAAYARIFDRETHAQPQAQRSLGQLPFASGVTRIENAWFVGNSTLRLMISGGADRDSKAGDWALRGYQGNPADPESLRLAGAGVRLPASGPVFHDVELLNPLMPLLLEIEDTQKSRRFAALMPFPSLLPGALHSAELRALQAEPNPMDAFWSLSELLLAEHFDASDEPSIKAVSGLDDRDEAPAVPAYVRAWLEAVFGISQFGESPARGSTLQLPSDCVPTISALVSRRLGTGSAGVGPFLVSDPTDFRPRWSVMLPPDWDAGPNVPRIDNKGGRRASGEPKQAAIHVAIALRASPEPEIPQPNTPAPGPKARRGALKLTAVLESSDAKRTAAVAGALRSATGSKGLELLVRMPDAENNVREALDNSIGADNWAPVAPNLLLPEIARDARHDLLLTISDRVVLDDPQVLHALASLMDEDERAASASCVLLCEASIKKQTVLQPASGGLFPAGVSFATSPSLTFSEPDVLQPLARLTYPVVANTFLLTLWRKQALAQLPLQSPSLPANAEDIHTGLALLKAGFRNLCTTRHSARIAGPQVRRDAIDPLGQVSIHPQEWEQVLAQVTLLRQLF